MTIAFPICRDRISPLLDAATRLRVVKVRRGAEVQRREVLLGPLAPDALARSVSELHVGVLLCGGVSEALMRELERRRVRVCPHLCGDAEAVLQAYCAGGLRRNGFHMPGCHYPCGCLHNKRTVRPPGPRSAR